MFQFLLYISGDDILFQNFIVYVEALDDNYLL